MKIICVLGAESTGTTTLAQDLAAHYRTACVPEYGRIYFEKNKKMHDKWSTYEFIHIANEQNKLEDEFRKRANKLLICDTNSFATSLWHDRYMGFFSDKLKKFWDKRKYDLYIVTGIDVPFFQDGTRDGESIRIRMHRKFIEEVKKTSIPYVIVSGSRQDRLNKSILKIREIFEL